MQVSFLLQQIVSNSYKIKIIYLFNLLTQNCLMYLKLLRIKKFRSIDEMDVEFNKGINIIIGENNSGKTAIIDALRICFSYGKQWRDIGIRNDEDFYIDQDDIDSKANPIEFHLHFTIENQEDVSYFTSMLWQDPADPNNIEIRMHFRYFLELTAGGIKKLKWRTWGGDNEGQSIDSNEAQLLFYTYLAPLRNAELELKPYARDNKVSSLFRELTSYDVPGGGPKKLDEKEKTALAKKLEDVVTGVDWKDLIDTGMSRINDHLLKADIKKKNSKVHIQLVEYEYDNIVKAVMTRKPVFATAKLAGGNERKQRYFDVSQNGLGENNLVFAASVLGDLINRRKVQKEHYYALLIEEPEAHLHPQRQTTFFNYLNSLHSTGVQIFITSHSPTLTAKSDLDDLIVLQHQPGKKEPFTVKNSEATTENKNYLRKFLDVTKSQLFFSNGTILVEGISEALLLPILALIVDKEYGLDDNGIEIVNINGVAFEPFASMYNSADPKKRMPSRCAILSDDDRGNFTESSLINDDEGITSKDAIAIFAKLRTDKVVDTSNRIINEKGYAFTDPAYNDQAAYVSIKIDEKRDLKSARARIALKMECGNLKTLLAQYTFEYELMAASEDNYKVMMEVYTKMHPKTKFMAANEPMKLRALEFVAKLDKNKDKSEFAQQLAIRLEQDKDKFTVPAYIESAIKWVVEGK